MHSLKRTLIGYATLRLTEKASDWKSQRFGCVERGRCSGLCTEFLDHFVVKAVRIKVFRYFSWLRFQPCTDTKSPSQNRGCECLYALTLYSVCACDRVWECGRRAFREGVFSLCWDKPLSRNECRCLWLAVRLSPARLTARHLSLSHGERAALSPGEKPLNPQAPATSHPPSAEMALPTAALGMNPSVTHAPLNGHTSSHFHTHVVFFPP